MSCPVLLKRWFQENWYLAVPMQFFSFNLKLYSSIIKYIPTADNFLYPSSTSLSQIHSPFSFLFRKEQPPKRQQQNRTKQDAVRQGKSSRIEAGLGNLIGGKECKEQAKKLELLLLPLLRVAQKHQVNSHYTYQSHLVQTLAGPKLGPC